MMKQFLRRAKSGSNTSRDEHNESSKKENSQKAGFRMFSTETSSVASGPDEPPGHTPPAQYIRNPILTEVSSSGSLGPNFNKPVANQQTMTPFNEPTKPHLKVLAEYFNALPRCDSQILQKLMISSEHYFRLVLESYEQLRAAHYRASQHFTLAEWLHIHALLLYGRIQQVQLAAYDKSGVHHHNTIDLTGEIKVFSPIASALAAIGMVDDSENGILYIPDAIFPQRPSSDAAYSASEMQNILDGTLYDWQRSWGRVLEARFERKDCESMKEMTRTNSELMLAIRETANSIDKIRARQQAIAKGDEDETFVMQLATKERNLSQLFEEARNAKDYTISPPCNQVYNSRESLMGPSVTTKEYKPSNNPKHPQDSNNPEVKSKGHTHPQLKLQNNTSFVSGKHNSKLLHSMPHISTQTATNFDINLDACPTLINKPPKNVIDEYNKYYPKVYTDCDTSASIAGMPPTQHSRRPFKEHAPGVGTQKLPQSKRFTQELLTQIPMNTTNIKSDGFGASRRLGLLRQQYNNQIALVPNAEPHLHRTMHFKTKESGTASNKGPGAEDSNSGECTQIDSQQATPANNSTGVALDEQEIKLKSSLSPTSEIATKEKAAVNAITSDLGDIDSPLLTPPDTSIDSDAISFVTNDCEFTAELPEAIEEDFASLKLNASFLDAPSTVASENLRVDENHNTSKNSPKSVEDLQSLDSSFDDAVEPKSPIDNEGDARNHFAIQSPLLSNWRFTSSIEPPSSGALLAPSASTSRKGDRKVTIGGSSDSLDQFVRYDAQLWSDYLVFVSTLEKSKLATFESMPSNPIGNLSWMLPVKVNHRSPQKEITMILPHKSVSKDDQTLALLLQTCHVRQQHVQFWHNQINISVDLRSLMSRYVAAAVDDPTR